MGIGTKWALGANGHLGKMGTRKHEHQGKQVFAANGHFIMGTLGPMDIGASEHGGKMGIWGKCTPGKMSTRANQQLRQMGTLEQICTGILGLTDIGADGHRHC